MDLCDVCGDGPAEHWTIQSPDDKYYLDVCDRHSVDLRYLIHYAQPAKKGPFGTEALRQTRRS